MIQVPDSTPQGHLGPIKIYPQRYIQKGEKLAVSVFHPQCKHDIIITFLCYLPNFLQEI